MLARLSVLIKAPFYAPVGSDLQAVQLDRPGEIIRVHPPTQSRFLAGGGSDFATDMLSPAPNPTSTNTVRINGSDTYPCDLVRVDQRADQFDRSTGDVVGRNQLIEVGFSVLNQWLTAFRVLFGAAQFKPVGPFWNSWRLDYLADDGQPLEQEPGLIRALQGIRVEVPAVATLVEDAWQALLALGPNYTPLRWDELLVDATELLPAVGPPVLLAYTAIEIRIADAAAVVARENGVREDLWRWLAQKRPYLVQPTTEEMAKDVFRMLTGRSLADEPDLWGTVVALRKARNSFAHEGVALELDGRALTPERAASLVAGARPVLDWIESQLPESQRRRHIEVQTQIEVVSPPVQVR
jgi:hypothetical protein